jgi:AcrR family transcriptional regulator
MARTRASDFGDKQRAILASAASVFARMGMEKASMAHIAAASGISKALLYHYYPSKNALIFGIVHSHLTELDEAIEAADKKDAPPAARLRLLVRQVLESYRDADDMHKVQLNCTGSLPAEDMEKLRVIERRIVRRFASVIREINPGLDKKRPLLMPVTMSLFGMMNWVYMWFRPGGPISREEYADLATALVLDGLKGIR